MASKPRIHKLLMCSHHSALSGAGADEAHPIQEKAEAIVELLVDRQMQEELVCDPEEADTRHEMLLLHKVLFALHHELKVVKNCNLWYYKVLLLPTLRLGNIPQTTCSIQFQLPSPIGTTPMFMVTTFLILFPPRQVRLHSC
jgi:hypothetical protein